MTNEDLNVAIVRLQERAEATAADVHEIKEALVGSGGRPGLVERVTVTEQRVIGLELRAAALESSRSESARLPWKALMAVVGLATTLATALLQAIKHLGSG